ncbi:MAG: copper amine oxidase N-terminal domain-containing protein [Armatimonadetes bacterium]|nr:copper amine oxidase N-terminal domain-containing protein [Armatimonadota bacterium]
MVCLLLLGGPVFAAPPTPPPMPQMPGSGGISVLVDGEAVRFPDVAPQMMGAWVYVPLRGVFEKMGARVAFDPSNGLVSADRGNTHVELKVGSKMASINGDTEFMLQPAISMGGRTLVPLRFLASALGADVQWHGGRRVVEISTKGPRD